MRRENRTLKRVLTDPRLMSGIGNAYSDEILHRARLSPLQRIVYAANECNYCATCQTGGKLLADRALSRLLRDDWPRILEELEEMKAQRASRLSRGEGT